MSIAGPCEVSSTSATACPSGVGGITEFDYYSATLGNNNAGRLQHVNRYPATCTSTPLVTTYDKYTDQGDPRSVTDSNGVETVFDYGSDRRIASRTIGTHVWQYTWENGRLTALQFPEATSTYCYHQGSTCTGDWSEKLLSMTKESASTWSERTRFTYWPNGALRTRSTYTNNGGEELRSQQSFDLDAEQRPTFHQVGEGSGSFIEPKAFDGAGNSTAIGLAYNGALFLLNERHAFVPLHVASL
ncbi:MAG: hypothetical protein IPJ65_37450 [Archangiaceae bacterium]|nr:hypothetical protein [Archangiaceae bacterium]